MARWKTLGEYMNRAKFENFWTIFRIALHISRVSSCFYGIKEIIALIPQKCGLSEKSRLWAIILRFF
jgi:hypothetical protein